MKASRNELVFAGILVLVMGIVVVSSNPKPLVIPAVREWASGFGRITLHPTSRICIDPEYSDQLENTALTFQEDLFIISGLDLSISCSEKPFLDDFYLTLEADDPTLGTEGYQIQSGLNITIQAASSTGVYYGTRTILQILKQDESHTHIPRGWIKDYPQWQVRGFMLDVGRMYFPMETLRDYVKFMGWYKMNEFHIHLNDNKISPQSLQDYSAFRLVSNTFPGLAAEDGAYTMEEWDELEELAAVHGVKLLPEIDSPAHALAFTSYRPELAYSEDKLDQLNLKLPQTYEFMSSLWKESLSHMNTRGVHLGGDEYMADEEELYISYMNDLNQLAMSQGKSTRMWGSLGRMNDPSGLSRDITLDIWKLSAYSPEQAIADGFHIVNVLGDNLYIVPLAGTYHDFLDTEWIYRDWQPNYFGSPVDNVFPADSRILGGKFAVWNDRLGLGYSIQDVYRRVKPAMQAMSEKLWNPVVELGYLEYTGLCQKIGDAPGTGLQDLPNDTGANLALNRMITVSSIDHGSPYWGENMVDGWTGTRWVSDDTHEAWLIVDLGDIETISQINLAWDDPYASAYRLQSSTNGIIWNTILDQTSAPGGREEITFIPLQARYLRLLMVQSSAGEGYSLQEIEVLPDHPDAQ